MRFLTILMLIFFSTSSLYSFAQKRFYDVKIFGSVVGAVTVEKKVLATNRSSFHFNSDAEAVLFFVKTKTHAVTNVTFENNILVKGYVLREKNEERQELFYTWDGSKYLVKDDGKNLVINKKISYCTANFFMQEPTNIKEVFVERFNYFVPIEHLGNGQYLTKVDGGTNLYTYKNGILQSLKSTKGVSIYMELR